MCSRQLLSRAECGSQSLETVSVVRLNVCESISRRRRLQISCSPQVPFPVSIEYVEMKPMEKALTVKDDTEDLKINTTQYI